ncbi:DUF1654 domain-containing protein [Pseudomonas guariconensis]|uniref:DUF1654 domain-containing protein n=1 Tax=Pseudomonas guariconensis TaxID=1288410 RepID=UPI002D1EA076|nr:DUF1654 domain-containing protein [Pseudomonas guariconensis]MEB3840505.1 DUF1654 domain-containing protein [Pseudomonas guariconensis]MEB3873373.1 DUF1654 domain-containing protein [Pseudomonas guariconensis]MEB3879740.1 DUF1654 domain-containing protein [Pseudomonas guariconensis]MEB3895804.1 DUF1654 domain-containing protein [Pseudomonas guariconensis]
MAAVLEDTSTAARPELTGLERLGLRVSAMINSPLAQLGRRVLIHRLDTDSDQDWDAIMELLSETDGLDMTFCDDGSVILQWEKPDDGDQGIEREDGGEQAEVSDEDPPF